MRRAALTLVVLAASAHAQGDAQRRVRRLTVIGINDVHGALLPAPPPRSLAAAAGGPIGGAEWFAGWMNAVRAAAREDGGETILLDGGDELQGTLISNQFQGRSVVEVFNAVGVAAAALGNHEFDWGIETLVERMREARYPVLAANVFLRGTRTRPEWIRPSTMLEVGGVRIGVVGLSTVETPTVTNPLVVEGLEFAPGGPIAAKEAAALRARGATVVLLVAHAGPLGPAFEIQEIAEAVRGQVDAIVCGHHHVQLGPPPLVASGIPIVQAGAKLTAFSAIDLTLGDDGRVVAAAVNEGTSPRPGGPQTIFHAYQGRPAQWRGREVQPDARVAALVRRYDVQVQRLRETPVGRSEIDLRKGGLLGNLIADALRSGAGGSLTADFALQNSGGLRVAELKAGPITFGELFDLYPFDNRQVVVSVGPQIIRDALETVLRAGKQPLQVSGLRYTVEWDRFASGGDPRRAPPGALVARIVDERTGKALCETRSCSTTACEAPCSPGTYKVSVPDFLADGGDGLSMLKDAPRRTRGTLARDIVVSYVKERSPITAQLAGGTPRVTVNGNPPRAHVEVQ
jgi:2',3'-cyclic-nucleotide 2'-phosphodiesterase (5'-nucleotidase family)